MTSFLRSKKITLVTRLINYNTIAICLRQFCDGFVGVENPHIGVKFSKVLQNCYNYVANTLLVCSYIMSKSKVQNVLNVRK